MPYKINWIIPNQILYIYSYGFTSLTDGENMIRESFELAEKTLEDHEFLVHVITDSRHVTKNDVNVNDMRRIFSEQKGRAQRPGWTMVVTPSPILRFLGSIALQFMDVRGRQVATVEDAIEFLVDSDDNLPSKEELLQAYQAVFGKMQMDISVAK